MKHTRILLLLASAAVTVPTLRGATIVVSDVADGVANPSLRHALANAQDGDTITFDPSLGGRDLPVAPILGQLVVDKSVTITWVPTPGWLPYLGIDGYNANRVFYIAPGKTVTISGLAIKNGVAPLAPPYGGGGILVDHADLTLTNCTISGNTADRSSGGGIYNYGDGGSAKLTITNCTISGNRAWPGGGIFNSQGTVTITNSTLRDNADTGANYGGAIANTGALTIARSTLAGNSAAQGGAIYNGGFNSSDTATLAMSNCTISGSSASSGGGLYNDFAGIATMTHCTISGNSAGGFPNYYHDGTGGGIYNGQTLTLTNCTFSGNSGTNHGGGIYNAGNNGYTNTILTIGSTILNAGSSGENIYNDNTNYYYGATVTSLGYNVTSDNGGGLLVGTGDQINTDPKLGPLQDNGGPTLTHLPAPDSPAIDGGDPDWATDQRGSGFSRVVNNRIDVGAVEVQPASTPTPTPGPTPKPRRKPGH